ncbi:MAG: DUF2520 domain-containing protein [Solirubrobacteraceae bacterium]
MRELERLSQLPPAGPGFRPSSVAVVGRGRLGFAIAAGLRRAGVSVAGPLGRGATAGEVDAVLLCVPDAQIAAAAALLTVGPAVGHCSGATGLDVLAGHEAFSLHPLMTIAEGDRFPLTGAGAAVAGSTPRALQVAVALAEDLGLSPIEVAPEDRAAYHAAASIASNFLVTLEAAAERLAAGAGVGRSQLVPLVRATVENWARLGPRQALTGPVARGDERTIERQREAVGERAPDLLRLFDALVEATRDLAATNDPAVEAVSA